MPKKIGLLMGSFNDFGVVQPAIDLFKIVGLPYEAHVYSAHRTPQQVQEFAESARGNGFGVLIAAAGMAAHLAGAVAAHTTLPVIGIPVRSSLDGLDALLATVQMPPGVPVATVAVNGAHNAALLAMQMLAIEDAALAARLTAMRTQMAQDAQKKETALQAKLQESGGDGCKN